MPYVAPVQVWMTQLDTQIEKEILKAVQRYGIHVDKDELVRALNYDREQYRKGFNDGYEKGRRDALEEMK